MAGRSLKLSQPGQQQARQALLVRNLTQKAVATELAIASWSTVSKFFNGKPVDRFIFQEICEALNLDWQEVVAKPEELGSGHTSIERNQTFQKPDHSEASANTDIPIPPFPPLASRKAAYHPLLAAVQNQAKAAREALTPRILERISRKVVREKYLCAIARGVDLGRERLIPIIGPAGYGKSTILGDIYDELIQADTPWVGLVLCSGLSFSTGYLGFMSYGLAASTITPVGGAGSTHTGPSHNQHALVDKAIGHSLCGESRSMVEVAQTLNQTLGRGVLLIDTLDLVINRDFVIIFGALMRRLLAQGTTVVFTA
jgi:hypothetical protein